jgi:hypothetical protein
VSVDREQDEGYYQGLRDGLNWAVHRLEASYPDTKPSELLPVLSSLYAMLDNTNAHRAAWFKDRMSAQDVTTPEASEE